MTAFVHCHRKQYRLVSFFLFKLRLKSLGSVRFVLFSNKSILLFSKDALAIKGDSKVIYNAFLLIFISKTQKKNYRFSTCIIIRKGEGEYNFSHCLCKVVFKLCCHDDITTVKTLQTEGSKLFTQEYQKVILAQDRRLESAEQHFRCNLLVQLLLFLFIFY